MKNASIEQNEREMLRLPPQPHTTHHKHKPHTSGEGDGPNYCGVENRALDDIAAHFRGGQIIACHSLATHGNAGHLLVLIVVVIPLLGEPRQATQTKRRHFEGGSCVSALTHPTIVPLLHHLFVPRLGHPLPLPLPLDTHLGSFQL